MSLQDSVIGYSGRHAQGALTMTLRSCTPPRGWGPAGRGAHPMSWRSGRRSGGWGPAGRGAHTNRGVPVVTRERFEQGLTLQQYVDHMSVNRERFVDALDDVTLGPADAQILERLAGARHVLVISEEWCGTCLAHMPYVPKLRGRRPATDLRHCPHATRPPLLDQ